MQELIYNLKRDEGFRDEIYADTIGYLTCGWGHRLKIGSKVPLEICEAFFKADLARAINDYFKIDLIKRRILRPYPIRQRVIVEMLFGLGLRGVLNFKRMWIAIGKKDFETAADEMLDSRWHQQVGKRAERLADEMRSGG